MNRSIVLAFVACVLLHPAARAQITFTKVADTGTAVPGGSGTFTSFGVPAVSGPTVAFFGYASATQYGIYTGSTPGGPVARVVDQRTSLPSGSGTFTNTVFTIPSVSDSTVAFASAGIDLSGFHTSGVYTGAAGGGSLARVADLASAIPNGSGTFTTFSAPAVSGSTVAFFGNGSAGQMGVYTGSATGGSLARVADLATPIPGGTGTFTGFGDPNSSSFSAPAVSGSTVVFLGVGSGTEGIYYQEVGAGGSLSKLIAVNDVLDGKAVQSLRIGEFAADGTSIAFVAAFQDGSSGVYVGQFTPVPEPGVVLGLAATLLGAGQLLGRRPARA